MLALKAARFSRPLTAAMYDEDVATCRQQVARQAPAGGQRDSQPRDGWTKSMREPAASKARRRRPFHRVYAAHDGQRARNESRVSATMPTVPLAATSRVSAFTMSRHITSHTGYRQLYASAASAARSCQASAVVLSRWHGNAGNASLLKNKVENGMYRAFSDEIGSHQSTSVLRMTA